MALPALWPDQHDPRGLNEQNAQVAVAAFRYLAKDRAVSSGDLPLNEAQPGSEVAAFGEHIAGANRSYHRTGDDWPDAGHRHQPFAATVLAGQLLDFC